MKLTDLQPCTLCGGKIAPIFFVVEMTRMVINTEAINRTLGLAQILGGSVGLAEAMGPDSDVVDKLDGKKRFVCSDCVMGHRALRKLFFNEEDDVADEGN